MELQIGTRDKRYTGEGLWILLITAFPGHPPTPIPMKNGIFYFLNERSPFTDKKADEKLWKI